MKVGLACERISFGDSEQLNGFWCPPAGGLADGAVPIGVVVVHGWAGDPWGNYYTDPLLNALHTDKVGVFRAERGGSHVLAFRGPQLCGASMQTIESELEDTTAAVRAAREYGRLGHVVLVGFSIGATLAAMEAVRDGAGVDGVVLISPTLMHNFMARIDERHADLLGVATELAEQGCPNAMVVHNHRAFGMPIAAAAYASLSKADIAPHLVRLNELGVPLLVLHGSEDPAIHLSYGVRDSATGEWGGGSEALRTFMQVHAPRARVVELVGAGHDPAGEHAELAAQEIRAFVGGAALGGAKSFVT